MRRVSLSLKVLAVSMVALVGCRDLVVKVNKAPKNIETSGTKSSTEKDSVLIGFDDKGHFLKDVDGLRTLAVDKLIDELAKGDYRKRFRDGFRFYRKAIIEKAARPVADKSLFDTGDKDCINAKDDINIEDADKYLGIVLQAGVLATISSGGVKVGGNISKELAAASELVLKDLGIEAKGESSVEEKGGKTTTLGNFSLRLISDKSDDELTKAADEAEVLKLKFERVAGEHGQGTFSATLSLGHLLASGAKEILALDIKVSRERDMRGLLVHSASVKLGIEGKDPFYSHAVSFSQKEEGKKIFIISDVMNKGGSNEKVLEHEINLETKQLCKLGKSGGEKGTNDKDNKGGYDDKGGSTGGSGSTGGEPNPVPTATPAPTSQPTPAPTPDPCSGVVKPGQCGNGNPGQGPGQSPSQTK